MARCEDWKKRVTSSYRKNKRSLHIWAESPSAVFFKYVSNSRYSKVEFNSFSLNASWTWRMPMTLMEYWGRHKVCITFRTRFPIILWFLSNLFLRSFTLGEIMCHATRILKKATWQLLSKSGQQPREQVILENGSSSFSWVFQCLQVSASLLATTARETLN